MSEPTIEEVESFLLYNSPIAQKGYTYPKRVIGPVVTKILAKRGSHTTEEELLLAVYCLRRKREGKDGE